MTVFGRLDVLYPDGRTVSHQLADERLTVGSAASDAIQLDDEDVAAGHFSLAVDSNVVSITDRGSVTGTFIAGQRLVTNVPRTLRAVEDIRLGALRLTYYQRSDSPTVAMPALGEQTQPAAPDFRARLESGEYTVFPASSVSITMEVTNLSQNEAGFRVETSGLPDDWVKPGNFPFLSPAGETTQLQFQIKPARRSDMTPGEYPLTITVTSLGDVEQIQQLVALVNLGGYNGLSMELAPTDCREGEPFSLFLLNQGNERLQLALVIRDPNAQLATKLTQDQVELPPGGRRRITGSVRARRRSLIGKPVLIPFALVAQSTGPSAYTVAAPARVSLQPRWSYRAIALVVAAVITLLLGGVAIFVQPPEPEITRFKLSHAQVAQGTPVQLNWTAANAERFVVEVNRARVAELKGDTESFTLETANYVDPIDIALIALQDELTVIETRRLDVYQPVSVTIFEANKSAMLRRVTESLIVRWELTGAVSLDITSPLEFETARETPATASRGEIELRGAPDSDFEIRLTAEDEQGAIIQRIISIGVNEPECLPLLDALLYAGPDKRFPQVRLAVENVPVLVRGTVDDGSWLQVELASGHAGWGIRSHFECRGFDTNALRVIRDLPLPPSASDSPTPTASPTAAATQTPTPNATASPTSADATDS